MSVISSNEHTIKLFYSSETSVGKQTLGHINSVDKDVLEIDVTKTKVTGTMWKTIAENLNCNIGDLIAKEHPKFTSRYNDDTDLSEDGWIKVLNNSPEVLAYPILMIDDEFHLIKNPSDVLQLLEPNSN